MVAEKCLSVLALFNSHSALKGQQNDWLYTPATTKKYVVAKYCCTGWV